MGLITCKVSPDARPFQMIQLAVIADDLTGAADTAIQFRHIGAPLLLVSHRHLSSLGLEYPGGTLAVYTDSRQLSPAAAAARVRRAGLSVKELAPRVVYKKIDSCLRGNIGAEVDALLDSLGCEAAFIAPAFPAQGRTTRHDIHFVRGVPLAASEMARDPVSPIRDSRVSKLIALQSRYPVGRIDVAEFDGGLGRLQEATDNLLRQGRRLLVFDAASQQHLELIAGLTRDHFPRVLLAGSAGLALALAQRLPAGKESRPRTRLPGGSASALRMRVRLRGACRAGGGAGAAGRGAAPCPGPWPAGRRAPRVGCRRKHGYGRGSRDPPARSRRRRKLPGVQGGNRPGLPRPGSGGRRSDPASPAGGPFPLRRGYGRAGAGRGQGHRGVVAMGSPARGWSRGTSRAVTATVWRW